MKKKLCWFFHNHSQFVGYKVQHRPGKVAKAPKYSLIVKVIKCKDCTHCTTEFFKEHDFSSAHSEVSRLNQELNLKLDYENLVFSHPPVDFI